MAPASSKHSTKPGEYSGISLTERSNRYAEKQQQRRARGVSIAFGVTVFEYFWLCIIVGGFASSGSAYGTSGVSSGLVSFAMLVYSGPIVLLVSLGLLIYGMTVIGKMPKGEKVLPILIMVGNGFLLLLALVCCLGMI